MWIREKSQEMDIDQPKADTWNHIESRLWGAQNEDSLKDRIAEHKSEFDIDIPTAESWQEIKTAILRKGEQQPGIKRILIYLSAACIITIISLGIFRLINVDAVRPNTEVVAQPETKEPIPEVEIPDTTRRDENQVQVMAKNSGIQSPAKAKHPKSKATRKVPTKSPENLLPPELVKLQKDYDQLISGQIAYTKSLAVYGESVDYFQRFMNDFKLLDRQEKELRLLIAENGMQETSIEDLGMIYQQKLTVLKKLQNEINKTSSRNNNLNDTIPAYINL